MLAYCYGDPHNYPELGVDDHFDPLIFAAHNGELAEAAAHAEAGEIYRKSLLCLAPADQRAFEAHLADRGLCLIDDGSFWLFAAAAEREG